MKPFCPDCGSTQVRYRSTLKKFVCRICGNEWKKKVKKVVRAAIIVLFLAVAASAGADQCGCNRVSDDKICVAYYELRDAGFDVKVFCNDEPKYKGVEIDYKSEEFISNAS